jgi:predicted nucleotidyltransferase
LEGFFGSKAKVRIIREAAAHPGTDYSVEDLAKAVGMSYGTVHPAVAELAASRALVSRKAGRSKLYMINRKHPIFREVQKLIEKEKSAFLDIAKDFVKNLDKGGVESIILFGSAARHEPLPGDIDILIVTRNDKKPCNFSEMAGKALEESDTVISPICLSKQAVARKVKNNDGFMIQVINEGKVLWGEAKWLGM